MGSEKSKEGHRARLKNRFLAREELSNVSLLELLLTYSIPRRDVHPLAQRLLETFGSFSNLLSAPPEKLKAVKGLGENSQILIELVAKISGAPKCHDPLPKRPAQPKIRQPLKDKTTRYNASFTVGALLVPETRLICKHLLKHKDGDIWEDIIYRENILQQRSPKSAQRIGGLIRQRLLEVGPEIHKFIAEGDLELATQATLVATIKQNRLLGDFMRTVLQDHFRTYQPTLEKREWNKFIGELELSAEDVKSWSERTKRDLGIRVYKALIEAGYLSDTKKLLLQRVTIRPEILSYLDTCNEDYVRECMDVC